MKRVATGSSVALLAISPFYAVTAIPAALLAATWLVDMFSDRRRPALLPALVLGNILWWLLTFAIHPVSLSFGFVRWQGRAFLTLLPLLALTTPGLRLSESSVRWGARAMLVMATATCAVAVVQYVCGFIDNPQNDLNVSFYLIHRMSGQDWLMGFFRSHSAAGGYFMITVVLCLGLLVLVPGSIRRTALLLTTLGLNTWALIFTKSRLGVLGAAAGAVVIVALLFLRVRRGALPAKETVGRFALAAVISLGAALAVPGGASRMALWKQMHPIESNRTEPVETGYSRHQELAHWTMIRRLDFWYAGARMFLRHPLVGVGFGSYPRHVEEYVQLNPNEFPDLEMVHAHNSVLQIAAETGVIGLLLYLVLWGVIVWRLIGLLRRGGLDDWPFAFAATCLACLLGQLEMSLADYNLGSPTVMLPLMTLVGGALALRADGKSQRGRSSTNPNFGGAVGPGEDGRLRVSDRSWTNAAAASKASTRVNGAR